MREQLPTLDGELQLPGLSAPVLVRRDEHGIPHIQAATMDDLLEAQGFVVAQDRLWQMDMARRFAAGELAELLGPGVVEHDKLQRVLQIRPAAEHLTATMPEDQKHLFEAFARGVNAFIAAHQDTLPAEFRLLGLQAPALAAGRFLAGGAEHGPAAGYALSVETGSRAGRRQSWRRIWPHSCTP